MKFRNFFIAVAIVLLSGVTTGSAWEQSVWTNNDNTFWNTSFTTPSFVYYTMDVYAAAGTYGSSYTTLDLHDAALAIEQISVDQTGWHATQSAQPNGSSSVVGTSVFADGASYITNAQAGYGAVRVIVWW